jgi:hypothetical protein
VPAPLLAGLLATVVGCGRTSVNPAAAPVASPSRNQPPAEAARPPQPAPASTASAPATAAAASPVVLELTPGSLTLAPGDDGAQLIVESRGGPLGRRDVTADVDWRAEPAGVVTIEPGGYLRPVADGSATIRAGHEGVWATASVRVEGRGSGSGVAGRPWDFGEDVVPVLTRSGCNTGSCHGRAEGQNGFHLSLFGYDPAGDYQALTHEALGRRIDRIDPARSLMLLKGTGRVPHPGGMRFAVNSAEYRTILEWIRAGAPEHRGTPHGRLASLRVEPPAARLDAPGPLQLRVVARYADGHERDVTRLASFRVNDDSVVKVTPLGRATLLRRAEADLVVRYQSQVVSTRLATLINPGQTFDFARLTRRNFIDEELFKRLESLNVPPSPPAGDAAFLRRVSLDLTGEQPSPEQVRKFLADTDPEKRVKLVDELLASPDLVRFWEIKLGDLLAISSTRLGNGAYKYQSWLTEQLRQNTPWDALVRTLLTAVGDPIRDGGPANYALDGPDAKVQAEQTAQRFLGLRLRCAQCHDHPFDVWTQDDYFGLAACFAKVRRGGGPGGGGMSERQVIRIDPKGSVEHLRTKRPAEPRLLDGKPVVIPEAEDPRKPLADWMTSADNPYFARALANWAWAQFFGKGLADPPDDLSRSNPPVHPELLDALARHFVAHRYDLKDLIRTIVTSEAYGLSSAAVPGNAQDTRLFSHQIPRPLTAHQMADALAQATDVVNRYPNRAAGTRAIEVSDPATASTILDTFGRCTRTNGCASVATPALSLRQSLLLIGGDVVEGKVANLNGYLANLLELKPEPDEIVENLYLRSVCRPPSAEELSHWSNELKQAASLHDAAEDLFWALLNSREFTFNH